MDTIINISAVKKKMKRQPPGQRVHYFFKEVPDMLSKEEVKEIREIIDAEHKELRSFLTTQIKKSKNKAA